MVSSSTGADEQIDRGWSRAIDESRDIDGEEHSTAQALIRPDMKTLALQEEWR